VTNATKPNAIDAFDWARYKAQGTGVEANLRNGATLGKLGTTANPDNRQFPTATTVNTTASRFIGTRYIFNVVRTSSHPAGYTTQQADAEKLIGVRTAASGGAGLICAGSVATQINLAGFLPLTLGATGGTGLPQSYCRLNPAAL
jgi:hypothetical protein